MCTCEHMCTLAPCTHVHCLALTGSGSQLSDVVMSRPSAVCVLSSLQQNVLQGFSHTLLQMLVSSLQHSEACSCCSVKLPSEQSEIISDCRVYYYVRDVHSLMWELVVWWALWEISVDYCSKRVQLMVQVLLKISQTPVSSNIPRWRLGAIKLVNGEWWCRQYQENLARPLRSETREWFGTKITKLLRLK